MQKKYLYITAFIFSVVILTFTIGRSNEFGANPGATGAPNDFYGAQACGTGGCHGVNPVTGDPSLAITMLDAVTNQVVTSYHVSRKYIVRIELTRASLKACGFESTVENVNNVHMGTIGVKSKCQFSDFAHQYVTHINSTKVAAGYGKWEYYWTSPATNQGDITVYAAGNCANNDGTSFGDSIFLNKKTYPYLAASGIDDQGMAEGNMSIYPNPVRAGFTISYVLKQAEDVRIELYNAKGQMVKTMLNTTGAAGPNTYNGNISEVGTGIYYIKIISGADISIEKLLKL
jgi:hypothetical protein